MAKSREATEAVGHASRTYVEVVKGTGLARQKAEACAKTEALEKALEAMAGEHLLSHRTAIEQEIETLKKKTKDTRSVTKQLDSLESWIPRETKRIEKLEQELEESRKALMQRKEDLQAEETRLIQLKKELLEEDGKPVTAEKPSAEKEAETQEFMAKELRRQLAKKRDASGAAVNVKQL